MLGMDRLGESPGLLEIGVSGLTPDHVAVRRIGQCPGDRRVETLAHSIETLGSALPGHEWAVPLVDVGGEEGCRVGVGAGDDHRRHIHHV